MHHLPTEHVLAFPVFLCLEHLLHRSKEMKSLFGNLSPCCLAANEFCKLSKTGGGWLFFSVLYYLIPQVDSSSFFFSHGSASIITNGWKWNHTVYRRSFLVQQESNSNQAFMDEILVWLKKKNWVWHCAWHSAEEMKEETVFMLMAMNLKLS